MANSPTDVLAEFRENMLRLHKAAPEVVGDFTKRLMPDVLADGALSTKVKELITLGIAVAARCDYCIAIHVKKCYEAGATKEEMVETLGVAILMGGGPALTYATFAMQAIDEFAPKGD